jgi:glycosyltransferase involved in cell wall biosynthesis
MISLIITSHNYAQYVERAIRSALDQSLSHSEYEIIVINDASTDHTADVLENYKDEVRVFNLDQNLGLAGARNFGIQKAKGQFIIFLDADDYIHRDLLKVEKLFLEENTKLDAVSTDYYLVNERGERIEHINAEEKPIACGIMFRKDFLYNIGLYDEAFRAREEEDLRIDGQSNTTSTI